MQDAVFVSNIRSRSMTAACSPVSGVSICLYMVWYGMVWYGMTSRRMMNNDQGRLAESHPDGNGYYSSTTLPTSSRDEKCYCTSLLLKERIYLGMFCR